MFATRILFATDGSEAYKPALPAAFEPERETGSEMHVCHVLLTAYKPPYARIFERRSRLVSFDAARVVTLALLDEEAGKVEKLGGKVAGTHYGEAKPAEEIGAGVVAAGFCERGPAGLPFSRSPSEAVLRRAWCAVVVVRGPKEGW